MAVFAVTTVKGPNWVSWCGIREQAGWNEHACFFDTLLEQGVVILGGSIASTDEADIALLAVTAADERELRTIFADDPWASSGALRIKEVREWTLWLDSRQGASVTAVSSTQPVARPQRSKIDQRSSGDHRAVRPPDAPRPARSHGWCSSGRSAERFLLAQRSTVVVVVVTTVA